MKGLGVSQGIGIGKVFKIASKHVIVKRRDVSDVEAEIERVNKSVDTCKNEINHLHDFTLKKIGKKEAEIFKVHLMILEDEQAQKDILKAIREQKVNAEYVLMDFLDKYKKIFEGVNDKYLRDRIFDVQDVVDRLIGVLSGENNKTIDEMPKNSILVARDLSPSETAQLDVSKISGIIVETGGSTSHAAIIARTMEIPTIVGAVGAYDAVENGDIVVMNGTSGCMHINPNELNLQVYQKMMDEEKVFYDKLALERHEECITLDDKNIHVLANIGLPKDADAVLKNSIGGVGLFRTEFLYMSNNSLPDEEQQFQAYKYVALKLDGNPVTIRTLDIGGDKELPYLNIDKEENPVLGFRAIRYCLDNIDVFKVQLRAILRASFYGNVRIMFPMISGITELKKCKRILKKCMSELDAEKIAYDKNIKIGMMIEVPSAALTADTLAKEIDFFSIGTNDLIQYVCAVDRENTKVLDLYQQFHPAILKLIKYVIDCAHKEGKEACMCGEMASEPALIKLLLGMGLDEFSTSSASTLLVKYIIRNSNVEECKKLVEEIEKFSDSKSIEKYLRKDFEGDFGLYVERC